MNARVVLVFVAAALLQTGNGFGLQTQQPAPAASPSGNGRPDLVTRVEQPPGAAPAVQRGGIVVDVEKMLEGGADAEVVKAYVQNWTALYEISADEILRLHDLGAPSEVLTALIRRSGELRATAAPVAPAARAQAQPAAPAWPPPAANEAPMMYSYPSSYPAYTYSYLYPSSPVLPSYSYSYWYGGGYWPYSYTFYWWPSYRYPLGRHFVGHRSWHGYRNPGYGHGYRHPGFVHRPIGVGHGAGFAHSRPFYGRVGGAWSPASAHVFRGSAGHWGGGAGRGFSGGGRGHR